MEISLIPKKDIYSIIPLLRILNETLSEELLQTRLDEMILQGYECVGIYDRSKLIGICGLWVVTKYYVGKHIEPDNMVFLPEYRSKGLGNQLMAWIYEYGISKGCVASELNCYLPNKKGNAFWENEGYEAIGFHYQKKLKS
ncbi:MAG: GNAT family N-acetyltransferase [Pseudomonadales bacterium]|nr:GNAT family N-acetyltransferase [Pseudomonadales bacterium]